MSNLDGEIYFETFQEYIDAISSYQGNFHKLSQLFNGIMTNSYANLITKQIIKKFTLAGWDMNKVSKSYLNDAGQAITPIQSACEYRLLNIIETLLACGARKDGLGLFIRVLSGHSSMDNEYYEEVEKAVKILRSYDVPKEMLDKYMIDECCEIYIAKSLYLREYLMSCDERIKKKEIIPLRKYNIPRRFRPVK